MKTAFGMAVASIVTALVLQPAARAGVIVVDPQGGHGGGAQLQLAIGAAQSGDIILLRPGVYTDVDVFVPGGKLISIVADAGGAQVTLRRLTVAAPGLNATLLLRDLRLEPPQAIGTKGPGLEITATLGLDVSLWIEGCTAFGNPVDPDGAGGLPATPAPGILLPLLTRQVVVRCEATGSAGLDAGVGWTGAIGGGAGLQVAGQAVVHECSFTGGAGGDGPLVAPVGADGGHGLVIPFIYLSLMDCTLQGGDEGAGNDASVKPGSGLSAGGAVFSLRGVVAQAGNVVGSGTPAADIVSTNLPTIFPAVPRGLELPGVVREGESTAVSVRGEAGDAVFAHVSLGATILNLPAKQGAFVLATALPAPLFLGAITDPSGTLDVPFTMPDLPAGTDGGVLFVQAFMAPTVGGIVIGSGSGFVWLDATL
jgi:hypothetical protein